MNSKNHFKGCMIGAGTTCTVYAFSRTAQSKLTKCKIDPVRFIQQI